VNRVVDIKSPKGIFEKRSLHKTSFVRLKAFFENGGKATEDRACKRLPWFFNRDSENDNVEEKRRS
jgi:hypothetical protein